jgi:hypothetical protein
MEGVSCDWLGVCFLMKLIDPLVVGGSAGWVALIGVVFVAGCRPAASQSPPVATVMVAASRDKIVDGPPLAQLAETGPLKITWEELDVGMEPDSVFESWMMTTRVKAIDGRQIRISGYISGAIFQKDKIREFPLMREKECPFGPGGQAHHVIEVELAGNLRTSFTTEPVTVEGIISIQPRTGPNGKTWSLYRLEATKIE